MLTLQGITKKIATRTIIDQATLNVEEGQTLCIVGPSGAGKTTLLRIIAGLTPYDHGKIELDGQPFVPAQDNLKAGVIGVVFQDFRLFPHLSTLENVVLAPRLTFGLSPQAATEQAQTLLAQLGLTEQANQYPFQLSGGQKQRVGIARALALKPRILCYDEPTSALDPNLRDSVRDLILQLKATGMTQIVVTHDLVFADQIADRTFQLAPYQS
ncbi:amino acid ABC transporter ATP-binding protein [Lapidilactobacillus achengensis]|uniref:Amino acid ABC transporter ATP-binding protein n=1 Tax=Lapidilactobacillus achengensis TaxID=2486000 RepID=A0ABW1UTR2_9LACO|nr:ATP-binding cassette domain-containing protein [Lapidilactobacillus achengensis]